MCACCSRQFQEGAAVDDQVLQARLDRLRKAAELLSYDAVLGEALQVFLLSRPL
jgi:hypothetical protein